MQRSNQAMKQRVSLIIDARWVCPCVPSQILLEQHAVVIDAGKIIDICPRLVALEIYQAIEVVNLPEHVLIPGLVNLHTHAAMSLMRGLADNLPLSSWLQDHIWPAEKQLVTPEFVYDGTLLAVAEMLSGGVTTFNDMYFYPDQAANASIKMGMRANIGLVVTEFATQYAQDADDYIKKGLDARDLLREQPLISFSFAPHAPYTVSDSTFERVTMLTEQVGITLHTHLHETQAEITDSESQFGLRPLARLADLGLLGPNMTLAHGVHMNDMEMQMLADHGCSIAHCPSSNLKLVSGIAPINRYLNNDINVGFGTDGAASNNRLDIFTEMRLAALLAKAESGDATALPAYKVLEMATINGAKALGLDDKIGSIEVGKLADLTAVALSEINMRPCFDPVSHLVYVAGREQVSHVWVDGVLRYYRSSESVGAWSGIEPRELSEIAARWQPKVNQYR